MTSLLVGILVFIFVAAVCYTFMLMWWPDPGQQRLSTLITPHHTTSSGLVETWKARLSAALLKLSPWTSSMSGGDTDTPSDLRIRFWNAGWRSPSALQIYYTCKSLLALVLPCITWLLVWLTRAPMSSANLFSLCLVSAAAAYYLPDGLLRWQVKRRQDALFRAFPNALDLLRVCIQAGLGLDAAIERVGREMQLSSAELSEEFGLTGLALRAGASRAEALQQLSVRVGLHEIEALVSMLIQADRFGTSVSESLMVYSDALRTQRRLKAEEAAAKLPVKLLIPLIFCVFPALLTVLLGPVVISLYTEFFKAGH